MDTENVTMSGSARGSVPTSGSFGHESQGLGFSLKAGFGLEVVVSPTESVRLVSEGRLSVSISPWYFRRCDVPSFCREAR